MHFLHPVSTHLWIMHLLHHPPIADPELNGASGWQIHWFSIINSCVTVLLLTGFLATILMRVLKNDFVKYTRDDDGDALGRRSTLHARVHMAAPC